MVLSHSQHGLQNDHQRRTWLNNPNLQAVENIMSHFRISIQMLSNGSDFFDVTLVWSDYKDVGANKTKTSGQERGEEGHLY